MTDDGEYLAVLDRFEGELAVLLLEREGEQVDEAVVPREDLPETARHQDAVLHVRIDDGRLVDACYDPDETDTRRETAQNRFDRLAERPDDDIE